MRGTLRNTAALTACATMAAMAGSAGAQTIGWLTTNFGAATPVESYGGGTVSNTSTGLYRVTFAGFGNGLNSDVQVTPVNYFSEGQPHYCTVVGWGSDSTDVMIDVECYNAAGQLANGDFALLYEARTAAPSSGYIAFAWADQATAASYTPNTDYSFNSAGGGINIQRLGVGSYVVSLAGAPARGSPLVTAYGALAAHCEVADWLKNRTAGVKIHVRCFNGAGQPADDRYDIAYAADVSHGDGPATGPGAYAWANNPTAANYKPPKTWAFNNISAFPIKGSNAGFGIGFLEVPVRGRVTFQPYLGLVTTVGSNGEYCDQGHIEQDTSRPTHPNFFLAVQCYNAQGQDLNTQFEGAIVTHPVG